MSLHDPLAARKPRRLGLYLPFLLLLAAAIAWTIFWLNNAAVSIMFPSLAMVLTQGESSPFLAPLIVSEFLALAAMLCFVFSVWSVLMKTAGTQSTAAIRPTAAE